MEIKKISLEKTAIHAVFWLSIVLAGLYHSYLACLASGIMAIRLQRRYLHCGIGGYRREAECLDIPG